MKYFNNRYGNSRVFGRAKCKMPMNLQFFAEGGDASGAGTEGNAGGAGGSGSGEPGAGTPGAGAEGSTPSFEELLKNPAYQSEFDKKLAKAMETSKTKIEKEVEEKIQAAKTEAEKMAKMNAEQKAQYEREKRDNELADREAQLTRRELSAVAKETLAEKGLPLDLAAVLDYSSAEKCTESIEAVSKAFQAAVERAVENRLQGGKPPKAAGTTQTYTKEQIAAMTPDEINKNWDAVQASMKNGL